MPYGEILESQKKKLGGGHFFRAYLLTGVRSFGIMRPMKKQTRKQRRAARHRGGVYNAPRRPDAKRQGPAPTPDPCIAVGDLMRDHKAAAVLWREREIRAAMGIARPGHVREENGAPDLGPSAKAYATLRVVALEGKGFLLTNTGRKGAAGSAVHLLDESTPTGLRWVNPSQSPSPENLAGTAVNREGDTLSIMADTTPAEFRHHVDRPGVKDPRTSNLIRARYLIKGSRKHARAVAKAAAAWSAPAGALGVGAPK